MPPNAPVSGATPGAKGSHHTGTGTLGTATFLAREIWPLPIKPPRRHMGRFLGSRQVVRPPAKAHLKTGCEINVTYLLKTNCYSQYERSRAPATVGPPLASSVPRAGIVEVSW